MTNKKLREYTRKKRYTIIKQDEIKRRSTKRRQTKRRITKRRRTKKYRKQKNLKKKRLILGGTLTSEQIDNLNFLKALLGDKLYNQLVGRSGEDWYGKNKPMFISNYNIFHKNVMNNKNIDLQVFIDDVKNETKNEICKGLSNFKKVGFNSLVAMLPKTGNILEKLREINIKDVDTFKERSKNLYDDINNEAKKPDEFEDERSENGDEDEE